MVISTHDGQFYEDELSFHLNKPMNMNEDKPQRTSDLQNSVDDNKKIYYVRHGDTNLNVESGEHSDDQPVRGWSQVNLNDDGRAHAQKAASSISGLPIEHIVASDLPRAAQTARIIGNKNDLPIEYDPGLRTWDLGAYTEQKGKDVHDAVNRLCTEAQDERPPSNSKYTGESFNEFKDRVLGAVSGIVQRHKDKEILLVSHNSPERVLHAWTEAGQPHKELAQQLPKDYKGNYIYPPSKYPGNINSPNSPFRKSYEPDSEFDYIHKPGESYDDFIKRVGPEGEKDLENWDSIHEMPDGGVGYKIKRPAPEVG